MRIKNLVMTCGGCPSQWEALTEQGKVVFIYYRHGELEYGIGRDLDEAIFDTAHNPVLKIGGRYDGRMTTEEMLKHLGWETD